MNKIPITKEDAWHIYYLLRQHKNEGKKCQFCDDLSKKLKKYLYPKLNEGEKK